MAILVPPIFPQQMALPSLPLLTSPSHTQTFFTLRRTNTVASLAETRLGQRTRSPLFFGERPDLKYIRRAFLIPCPPAQKYIRRGAFPLPLYPPHSHYTNPHGGCGYSPRHGLFKPADVSAFDHLFQPLLHEG